MITLVALYPKNRITPLDLYYKLQLSRTRLLYKHEVEINELQYNISCHHEKMDISPVLVLGIDAVNIFCLK